MEFRQLISDHIIPTFRTISWCHSERSPPGVTHTSNGLKNCHSFQQTVPSAGSRAGCHRSIAPVANMVGIRLLKQIVRSTIFNRKHFEDETIVSSTIVRCEINHRRGSHGQRHFVFTCIPAARSHTNISDMATTEYCVMTRVKENHNYHLLHVIVSSSSSNSATMQPSRVLYPLKL